MESKRTQFDFSQVLLSNQYTETEKKVIYALLVMEIKDTSKIAKMIGISRQQVYNCIHSLRKKGFDLWKGLQFKNILNGGGINEKWIDFIF